MTTVDAHLDIDIVYHAVINNQINGTWIMFGFLLCAWISFCFYLWVPIWKREKRHYERRRWYSDLHIERLEYFDRIRQAQENEK